jgi:hypothetical protein
MGEQPGARLDSIIGGSSGRGTMGEQPGARLDSIIGGSSGRGTMGEQPGARLDSIIGGSSGRGTQEGGVKMDYASMFPDEVAFESALERLSPDERNQVRAVMKGMTPEKKDEFITQANNGKVQLGGYEVQSSGGVGELTTNNRVYPTSPLPSVEMGNNPTWLYGEYDPYEGGEIEAQWNYNPELAPTPSIWENDYNLGRQGDPDFTSFIPSVGENAFKNAPVRYAIVGAKDDYWSPLHSIATASDGTLYDLTTEKVIQKDDVGAAELGFYSELEARKKAEAQAQAQAQAQAKAAAQAQAQAAAQAQAVAAKQAQAQAKAAAQAQAQAAAQAQAVAAKQAQAQAAAQSYNTPVNLPSIFRPPPAAPAPSVYAAPGGPPNRPTSKPVSRPVYNWTPNYAAGRW